MPQLGLALELQHGTPGAATPTIPPCRTLRTFLHRSSRSCGIDVQGSSVHSTGLWKPLGAHHCGVHCAYSHRSMMHREQCPGVLGPAQPQLTQTRAFNRWTISICIPPFLQINAYFLNPEIKQKNNEKQDPGEGSLWTRKKDSARRRRYHPQSMSFYR